MEALILLLIGAIALPILALAARGDGQKRGKPPRRARRARRSRCPNCGSPVIDHGSYWECGWCGDHGN